MSACGWSEARSRAHAAASPLPPVELAAVDALGCTLARALVTPVAMPPFDSAAMDGYAVRGRPPWRVAGQVFAGAADAGSLRPGTAVEIGTGAVVPTGAEAVLPYEYAQRSGDLVTGEVAAGRHIRRLGEAAPAGAELATAGTALTPPLLGLAASVGVDALTVRRPARVTALVIGDEVGTTGLPGAGRIRDAIGPMLPGLVPALGGQLAGTLRLGDRPAELAAALAEATGEIVLTCGASSVGRADTVRSGLRAIGATLLVDGVRCRPGHPQALASLPDGRWLVALPGNPYAALVAALTLLGPLLAGLAGRALPELPAAELSGRTPAGLGRPAREGGKHGSGATVTRLIPVTWRGGTVWPVGTDRPASLQGAALAEALAVVPPDWAGELVRLVPLPS